LTLYISWAKRPVRIKLSYTELDLKYSSLFEYLSLIPVNTLDTPCVHLVLSNILLLWILGHPVLLGYNTESKSKIIFFFLALTQNIAKDDVNIKFLS